MRNVDARSLFMEAVHFQQMGLEAARPGDELEFIKADTLKPYHTARLRTVCTLNKQISLVEFDAGVYLSGDANFWFESGPLSDVLIHGNVFENCCFLHGSTGRTTVTVALEIPRALPDFYYHRNIRIQGNTFIGNTPNAMTAHSVDGIEFTENTFQRDSTYTTDNPHSEPIAATHCRNVIVRE